MSPPPHLKPGQLEQVAQSHVQLGFKYIQEAPQLLCTTCSSVQLPSQ